MRETAVTATDGAAPKAGEIWLLLDSGGIGGVETHVRTLYLAFRQAGLPARVVLLRDNGRNPWLTQLAMSGIEPMILNGGFGAILKAIRTHRPAIVHTHGYKAGILGRLAARLAGAPIVSSFHAGERVGGKVGVYQRLDEYSSFLARRISVSAPIQDHLPFRSTLIPNFIVAPDQAPDAPLPPVIGFVGRLSPEKGPDLFCRLAAAYDGPPIEWRLYGDGPMRSELEAQFSPAVRFMGLVSNMADAWAEIGLLAMTSRAEGLPMSALEAGAAGIPILATPVGALPDVVDEDRTGWFLNLDELEAGSFESALEKIHHWRARDADGGEDTRLACWANIRDNFAQSRAVQSFVQVYTDAGARHIKPN